MTDTIQSQQSNDARLLLNTQAASSLIGISKSFLDKQRIKGDGPPFCKVGRRVFYRLRDIEVWLDSCRHSSTSSVGAR